jgi:hypothetical protein
MVWDKKKELEERKRFYEEIEKVVWRSSKAKKVKSLEERFS